MPLSRSPCSRHRSNLPNPHLRRSPSSDRVATARNWASLPSPAERRKPSPPGTLRMVSILDGCSRILPNRSNEIQQSEFVNQSFAPFRGSVGQNNSEATLERKVGSVRRGADDVSWSAADFELKRAPTDTLTGPRGSPELNAHVSSQSACLCGQLRRRRRRRRAVVWLPGQR